MLSARHSCYVFMKLESSQQIFGKDININVRENPSNLEPSFSLRTDRYEEANSPLS